MSIQGYSTSPSRNLIRAEQTMLRHAEPIIVLGNFGQQKQQPTRKTDTVVFRRVNPFNMTSTGIPNITVNALQLQEGTTPNAQTISYTDITVTLQQYGILYKYSSKVQLMYEDDIPQDMAEQTGEAMGELAELLRYGIVKGGTSVIYANGTSRTAVNTPLSLNKLRQASRTLQLARATRITQRLSSGTNYGTSPVEPAFLVFISTDVEADARNIPGFVKVAEYASMKPVHDMEIGCVENFRLVTSPLFKAWADAGGAKTGMLSTTGTSADVYPCLVVAKDAWGQVSLKGYDSVKATILPATAINHANPMGMFGYVGGSFWTAVVRLNENWMTRIEVAATDLS